MKNLKGTDKLFKFLKIIILLFLILLDWAALDDITTGSEPSFFLEYLIIAVSLPVYVLILASECFTPRSLSGQTGEKAEKRW